MKRSNKYLLVLLILLTTMVSILAFSFSKIEAELAVTQTRLSEAERTISSQEVRTAELSNAIDEHLNYIKSKLKVPLVEDSFQKKSDIDGLGKSFLKKKRLEMVSSSLEGYLFKNGRPRMALAKPKPNETSLADQILRFYLEPLVEIRNNKNNYQKYELKDFGVIDINKQDFNLLDSITINKVEYVISMRNNFIFRKITRNYSQDRDTLRVNIDSVLTEDSKFLMILKDKALESMGWRKYNSDITRSEIRDWIHNETGVLSRLSTRVNVVTIINNTLDKEWPYRYLDSFGEEVINSDIIIETIKYRLRKKDQKVIAIFIIPSAVRVLESKDGINYTVAEEFTCSSGEECSMWFLEWQIVLNAFLRSKSGYTVTVGGGPFTIHDRVDTINEYHIITLEED